MEDKILFTPDDIKKELGIGNDKVYALFNQPSFPSIKIGKAHYITRENFISWLDSITKLPNSTYNIKEPVQAVTTKKRRNARYAS